MQAIPKRAMVGERTQTLKAVPFFTQLSDRELDVVRAVATEKSYPKNAVVLTEGEMGDSLFMIQSGKVKVHINQRWPLKDAEAAHRALEGRATTGSSLLTP